MLLNSRWETELAATPTDEELERKGLDAHEPELFGEVRHRAPVPVSRNLPVPVSKPARRRYRKAAVLLLLLIGGTAGGFYWWESMQSLLPPGIFWGNGRIEADEIDISTKFAGRVATLSADQGDMVKAGQVVATMDTRDLEASLKKAQAQVELANRAIDEAKANVAQLNSQQILAQQQYDRAATLLPRGYQAKEVLDCAHRS